MIPLIIIGVILLTLLLLTTVLFLPLKVFVSFKEEFSVIIKFVGIKVFEVPEKATKKKTSVKNKSEKTEKEQKPKSQLLENTKQIFVSLKEKYGFAGAVNKIFKFIGELLSHIKPYLRHIKIKKIKLNLKVASNDAASTAIDYGKVCSAVYPVLAYLDTFKAVYFKEINLSSDFTSQKSEFDFSLQANIPIIYLFLVALKVVVDYKKFIEENNDERK